MVDARDLKSLECQNSCRFESGSRHQNGNNPESIGVFIIREIVLERSVMYPIWLYDLDAKATQPIGFLELVPS